jgi:hypothetical protein
MKMDREEEIKIRNRIRAREATRKRLAEDPEKERARNRESLRRWRENHPGKNAEIVRRLREANPEKSREYILEYNRTHKEQRAARVRERRHTDPNFNVLCRLQSQMYNATTRAKSEKYGRTLELLGCSVQELRVHLESQFQPGMTWENYGSHGWHIDHILPCISFDMTNPAEQRACFHWSNLQPLWESDNIRKGPGHGRPSRPHSKTVRAAS